jgi:hypothetical protein
MAGQRLIPEDRLLAIRTRIPSKELDDRALIARLKNAKGPSTSYEDFLVARRGESSISRETFLLYMEKVAPDPGIMEEWVQFRPTHRDRDGLHYMMIEKSEKGHRLLREDGVMGTSSHEEFSEFFTVI